VPRSAQLQQQELARSKDTGSKRRATVNVAKLLTNQIAAASSLDQLHDIVAAHGSYLDHIHVAKLLARTSQLANYSAQQELAASASAAGAAQPQLEQQQQEGDQQVQLQQQKRQQQLHLLCTSLTAMMVQRLRHSTAQSFVPAVAALGRLATLRQAPGSSINSSSSSYVKPSQQQLEQLTAKANELAPSLSISQLTVVLWGLAKAGLKPSSSKSSSWLAPLLEAFLAQYHTATEQQEQQLQEQQQEQQQQQQKAVTDRRLQRPVLPGKQQQQRWPELKQVQQQLLQESPLQQQQQQPVLQQHSLATDLSLVLYAMAVMGCQPEAAWLGRWQAAVVQQLPNANAQDLSQVSVLCAAI
jgi:hypothetical protein